MADGTTAGRPAFPEQVGRYEVLLPLASGGMATVYLARSTGLAGFEREVALKLTHAHLGEESSFATALVDEANLAGRIRHPNVVSVLDVGDDPHGIFLVMEYVEGDTLAGLARVLKDSGERFPERIALRVLEDVLAGLHAAHELRDAEGVLVGLVHRDVTPHNVLIGIDGVCKLADFGVAKAATRIAVTATGLIKGKVAYMAPEQALGRPLDRRCDVWAAGVVLWELLSGLRFHSASSDAATLLRVVSEPPLRLRSVRPDLAPELDDLVARALQMDRNNRYPTAEDFRRAVVQAADATCGRAEPRERGADVSELVGDRLETRRAKVAEVLELRGRIGQITRTALPSFPQTPSAVESLPGTEPTVVESLGPPAQVTSATAAVTAATEVVPFVVPEPAPPPSSPLGDLQRRSAPPSSPLLEPPSEATRTETISVATAGAEDPGELTVAPASWHRRPVVRLGIAAGALGLLGAVTVYAVRSPTPPEEHIVAAVPAAVDPSGEASAEASPLTPDELPLAAPPAPTSQKLTVVGAAPIVRVYVGKRRQNFDTAKREQVVDVTKKDEGRWIAIVTSDGRKGAAQLERAGGRLEVPLTSRVPAAGQGKKRTPLLTSPYEKKQ